MRQFISFLTIAFCSILAVNALQQRIDIQGKGFPLTRPIVVVSAEYDKEARLKITNLLDTKSVRYTTSNNYKITKQKIVLSRVSKIEGVEQSNAYYIKISPKKVLIQYTTQMSLDKAIEFFADLVNDNEKLLPGQSIYDWGESKVKKGVIDASTTYLSTEKIDQIMRYHKKSNVMLCVVMGDNWRMESTVFEVIDPQAQVYTPSEYYTFGQMAQLVQKYSRLIPMLDLMSPCGVFERATGHSQFSVEGMRFVRAIIEEFVTKTGVKRFCVGVRPKAVDLRYMDFLEGVARNLGVEMMVIE